MHKFESQNPRMRTQTPEEELADTAAHQSYLIPNQIFFASRIVKIFLPVFGCFHGPRRSCLLSPLRLLPLPQPYSFLCKTHTFLPNLLLRCQSTTLGRKHASQHQPWGGPHLSGSVWSTHIKAFEVLISSPSQCQLIAALPDYHIRAPFRSFRLPNLKCSRAPTSRARSLSTLMNSHRPSVRPLLLSFPRFFTIFCKRPSPSSCCFASNFNALIKFAAQSFQLAGLPKGRRPVSQSAARFCLGV